MRHYLTKAPVLFWWCLAFSSVLQAQGTPGMEIKNRVFDRKTRTVEVEFTNVSSKSIAAYVFGTTTRFVDGIVTTGELLVDLVPSIPAAEAGLFSNHRYDETGLMPPGQTRYKVLHADGRQVQGQGADSTAQGISEDAIGRIFSNRLRWARQYSEWLARLDAAATGPLVGRELLESLGRETDKLSRS